MIERVLFRVSHVRQMRVAPQYEAVLSQIPDGHLQAMALSGESVTLLVDGVPVGCGGVASMGLGLGGLWAFISCDAGPHMTAIFRCVRDLVNTTEFRRIEASTEAEGFPAGIRLLELLGFQSEGLMRKYGPDGADHIRYARI